MKLAIKCIVVKKGVLASAEECLCNRAGIPDLCVLGNVGLRGKKEVDGKGCK